MTGFLTGSTVYGEATDDSDIDLVIMVDLRTYNKLREHSDDKKTVRYGKLNLICCQDELEMAVWRVGTRRMMLDAHRGKRGRIKRAKDEAKRVLDGLRKLVAIFDRAQSGDGE